MQLPRIKGPPKERRGPQAPLRWTDVVLALATLGGSLAVIAQALGWL